jgi:hypothetical protein
VSFIWPERIEDAAWGPLFQDLGFTRGFGKSVRWVVATLHRVVPPHPEKLSAKSFFLPILNSLVARSWAHLCDCSLLCQSAALGEEDAICFNGVMIQRLLKLKPRLRPNAAVCERTVSRESTTTPLPLNSGTLDDPCYFKTGVGNDLRWVDPLIKSLNTGSVDECHNPFDGSLVEEG